MPTHDDLGTRMKDYYETIPKTRLMRRTPVAIRIDGKAFHTFTRGLKKPFDKILIKSMQDTMKYLCENIQGCVFGYTQSDEITLILIDYQTLTSQAWFNYEVQKMCSIAASMATMAFNKAFKPNKTDFDWLCADEEELQKYMLDSACADSISSGLFWQLLSSMRYTGSKSAYQNWKKDMPVLLLSGEKDPVGDFTKGVRRVEAAMKNVGMKNVTVQFLPEARHDIFHEVKSECAKKVVQLIKNWINA